MRMVSPAYKLHGEQIQAATWFREDNTITWHLIHVLEKLEQASPSLKSKRPAGPGRVIRLDERRSRTPRKERARLAEYLK